MLTDDSSAVDAATRTDQATSALASAALPRRRNRREDSGSRTGRWRSAPRNSRRSRIAGPLVVAVVFLVGMSVLLYPMIARWMSQYQQSQQIGSYSTATEQIGPEGREQALTDAHAYNALLSGGATVGAFERVPTGAEDDSGLDYFATLSDHPAGVMARLKIPGIDVDLPIYHGTSEETLLRGIGHLQGTALPVGGAGNHSVLTAHRGLAEAVMFNDLDQLEIGDEFTIEVFGEVLTYQVIETKVVEPTETESLYPLPGEDLVTLVTCTPIGVNSHRILVTAERITPTPPGYLEAAGEYPEVPGFPWWVVILGGSLLTATGYVWWTTRSARQAVGRSARRSAGRGTPGAATT